MAERVFASVVDDVERVRGASRSLLRPLFSHRPHLRMALSQETEEAEVRLRELKRSLRFHRSRLQRLRSERPEALNVVPHSRMEALERSKRRFVKHAMPYVVGELAASSFPAPTAPLQQSAAPPGQGRLSQGDGLATPPRSQRLSPPREAPGLAQDYLPPHMTRRLLRAISSQKSRYESRIAELEARLGESQPPSPAASRAGRSASARTKTPGTTRASPRSPHSGGPSVQPMPVSALPQHIPRSPAAAERLGESSPR